MQEAARPQAFDFPLPSPYAHNRRRIHSREENARHVQATGRPSRVLILVRHPPSRVHGVLHRRFDGRPRPGAFRIALHLHRRHRGSHNTARLGTASGGVVSTL